MPVAAACCVFRISICASPAGRFRRMVGPCGRSAKIVTAGPRMSWSSATSVTPRSPIGPPAHGIPCRCFPIARPYPWKASFEFSWLLARRGDRLDGYRQRRRGPEHVELLWDFLQRG